MELIKDAVSLDSNGFLKAEEAEDTEVATFVKFTEDHRRERQRRIDAGDETAKLKFSRPAPPTRQQPPAQVTLPMATVLKTALTVSLPALACESLRDFARVQ